MQLSPAQRLGRYTIVAPLGRGGMGEVYRARDSTLGRDVAIKIVSGPMVGNQEAQNRFAREAKAIAALSHRNILQIYDFGVDHNVCSAVMELLEGENLRSVITGNGIPAAAAVKIAISIAEGLAAAHSRGMIHRDLKPENIFITKDEVKILDFGLAQMTQLGQEKELSKAITESNITDHGRVLGTLPYMSRAGRFLCPASCKRHRRRPA